MVLDNHPDIYTRWVNQKCRVRQEHLHPLTVDSDGGKILMYPRHVRLKLMVRPSVNAGHVGDYRC